MKILFVCTGNTCRSAMAEAIFRDIADLRNFEISSAGLSTFTGDTATNKAIIVCGNHDIDLKAHRTTGVGDAKVNDMDLVLTATVGHREKIEKLYPNVEVHTIKEYAEGYDDLDIADPINGDLQTYEECFSELEEALEKVYHKILSDERIGGLDKY